MQWNAAEGIRLEFSQDESMLMEYGFAAKLEHAGPCLSFSESRLVDETYLIFVNGLIP